MSHDIVGFGLTHPGFRTASPVTIAVIKPVFPLIQMYDGGNYKVTGTIFVDPSAPPPAVCMVRLYCRVSSRFVTQVAPDPVTGVYLFDQIRQGPWQIIAVDNTNTYNAVIQDNVTAVPR